ncbi:hypothetical protein [Microbacterium sp. ZOR0019]|uniref:hypothetical protein n=1 Tax=Microbacterium sp. ZOR0019 TaxID=1339233 RepID=UPI000645D767|nr:hypothetical protein [Microbacterium sp. ZOR0019]
MLIATIFAPSEVERVYGETKIAITTIQTQASRTLPHITLGVSGDEKELDRCDGTFTEMLRYQGAGATPTWAAHNNCGGDAILPWEVGQQLSIDGTTYAVVDIRMLPKRVATSEDLLGIQGELTLQTCLYGQQMMKFVGVEKVAAAASR